MTLKEAEYFFGVPIHQVNHIITRVAMRDGGPPEWLRGRPTLVDLPRFVGDRLEHTIPVSREHGISILQDQLVWIVENLRMPWSLTTEGWSFKDANEALYFKMAF